VREAAGYPEPQAHPEAAVNTSAEKLQELSDPEFFAHWAAVRNRVLSTPKGRPEHREVRRRYDAAAAEYRRRIHGEDRK
jgi:hypothetical protein